MPSWRAVEEAEPEFAERVRRLFDAGRHKTIATLRADGSPRISGIECEFAEGDLRFGSMTGARKGADLRRDPRFALHGPPFHPVEGKEGEWPGEAKIAGRALPGGDVTTDDSGGEPDGELFVADIQEVVITGLDANARCATEEIFGPVVTVHAFDDEEEVLRLANGVRYGLSASVWTTNLARAHRVSAKLLESNFESHPGTGGVELEQQHGGFARQALRLPGHVSECAAALRDLLQFFRRTVQQSEKVTFRHVLILPTVTRR